MAQRGNSIKRNENTLSMYVSMYVCLFMSMCLLWKRSLFPCCVPGIEAACDLRVNKPETRGARKHMRTYSHIFRAMAWCFPDAPSLSLPPTSPGTLALHISHTHTHNSTSPVSLNHAYQSFCFFNFPFPCIDKTLHSQVLLFVSSSLVVLFNPPYDSQLLQSETSAQPAGISV